VLYYVNFVPEAVPIKQISLLRFSYMYIVAQIT